jgi:DNA (cytosine-5)-methyltransferase 3A
MLTNLENVLSLFDGISIARQAITNLGIPIKHYYASEIDKYAIQIAQKNFPDTIQLGDIRSLKFDKTADLIIGGSPCQDLSIAKHNRQGLSGSRSSLFFDYVRIVEQVKPTFFVLENVASMPKDAKQLITDTLYGIEPTLINAANVSAQNRKRLFWIGKLVDGLYQKINIPQPNDTNIKIKDILEANANKKYYISRQHMTSMRNTRKSKQLNIIDLDGKSGVITASYYKIPNDGNYVRVNKQRIRKLTPIECERLQGLPDNYTAGISDTQRYKTLGNGFNCKVIEHIISNLTI